MKTFPSRTRLRGTIYLQPSQNLLLPLSHFSSPRFRARHSLGWNLAMGFSQFWSLRVRLQSQNRPDLSSPYGRSLVQHRNHSSKETRRSCKTQHTHQCQIRRALLQPARSAHCCSPGASTSHPHTPKRPMVKHTKLNHPIITHNHAVIPPVPTAA